MIAKSMIAASLFAASLSFAPAAFAAEPSSDFETRSIQVRYADLNLASAQGQSQLDARLRSAARKVCSISYGPHPLSDDGASRKCYAHALDSARETLASAQYRKVMSR